MATPDELRAAIKVGREMLAGAITAAADNWEKTPADGWSPRKTAEHVIAAEVFFATVVCNDCGYDGPTSPFEGEPQFASAAEAAAALEQAASASDSKIKYVTQEDLAHPDERMGMGNVEGVMKLDAWHLFDHAMQIHAALR